MKLKDIKSYFIIFLTYTLLIVMPILVTFPGEYKWQIPSLIISILNVETTDTAQTREDNFKLVNQKSEIKISDTTFALDAEIIKTPTDDLLTHVLHDQEGIFISIDFDSKGKGYYYLLDDLYIKIDSDTYYMLSGNGEIFDGLGELGKPSINEKQKNIFLFQVIEIIHQKKWSIYS
jgi:hypothetical protein